MIKHIEFKSDKTSIDEDIGQVHYFEDEDVILRIFLLVNGEEVSKVKARIEFTDGTISTCDDNESHLYQHDIIMPQKVTTRPFKLKKYYTELGYPMPLDNGTFCSIGGHIIGYANLSSGEQDAYNLLACLLDERDKIVIVDFIQMSIDARRKKTLKEKMLPKIAEDNNLQILIVDDRIL